MAGRSLSWPGNPLLVNRRHQRHRQGHRHRARRAGRPGRHHRPGDRPAPRRPQRASAPRRAAQPSMLSPRTCRRKPGYAVWPLRYRTAYPRVDVLASNAGGFGAHRPRHRRWPGAHLRAEPPRAVPADQPAAGPPHRERTRPDPHRILRRPRRQRPHRLRRPAGRAELLRAARVQPVEAGQRDVHLRASPPPGRHRRDRHGAAPRRGDARSFGAEDQASAYGRHDPRGARWS